MNDTSSPNVTYADAGVNIDAGNALVDQIKPLVASTQRPGVMGNVGGFGGLFDLKSTGYKDPVMVAATDGVGTKLKIAFAMEMHSTIGVDLVAMCVNDLVVQGAEPLFFLDYFATGGLDTDVARDVISGIADGCKQAGCALIGGETAEMPGMYQTGHYDLAGFAVGAVERNQLLPTLDTIEEGDIILGLSSNGIHSNGYSLVRHILSQQNISFSDSAPFDNSCTIGETLLTPTKIYVNACMAAIKHGGVKALAHITGGGLTENLPRVLPNNMAASISTGSWEQPAIFPWLKDTGNITDEEMLRTFNCGIGMALIVSRESADTISQILQSHGDKVQTIGSIISKDAQNDAVQYI